ncbi:Hypothetical protein BSSP2_II0162 [Brucella suis bv. 2]|nr:Hypothetical protein BSSP3_II0162 [Brucella suis bv. 2]AIB32357.1 Hypothetical protein BSSP2_II0162 [Brucella suis bv. 2]
MSRRIAVQAGVFCAEQPDFRPVSACGEMHILPYLALSGPIWGLAACCSSHVGDNDRKRL